MKNISILVLIYILSIQNGFSQELKSELKKFMLTELYEGIYTFQFMDHKVIQGGTEKQLLLDENGKILYPKVDFGVIENGSTTEFSPSSSIKLIMKYKDSILTIRPIDPNLFPLIKIDLKAITAYVNDCTLNMVKKISIKDKENGFNSAWDGFQWHSNLSGNSNFINPRLTIGKLEANDKLYIEILWIEKEIKMHYRLLT